MAAANVFYSYQFLIETVIERKNINLYYKLPFDINHLIKVNKYRDKIYYIY